MSAHGGRRGEIQLGELIRAFGTLSPQNAEHAQAIAGCLGFGLAAADIDTAKPTPAIYDRSRLSAQASADRISSPQRKLPPVPSTRPEPVTLPERILSSTLRPLAAAPPADSDDEPDWLAANYPRLDRPPGVSPPRQTLFPERSARGIFTAALATQRLGSELDVDRLIRQVVQGRVPAQPPRLPSSTLVRGCQLLLDFSDSMLPWWEDLRQLATQLTAVLGEDRLATFDFASSPGQVSRWLAGKDEEQPWRPEPGRPLLLATDFGIQGRPAGKRVDASWPSFIDRCAAAGCPLIVLIPWSPEYWPTGLGPYPALVHWHPNTSAAMLRRQIGAGHELAR